MQGPWCPSDCTKLSSSWKIRPIIQHGPGIAKYNQDHVPTVSHAPTSTHRPSDTSTEEWKANQNLSLLAAQYGGTADGALMTCDSLYALSGVFKFVATSEKQVLNITEKLISDEMDAAEDTRSNDDAIYRLRILKQSLDASQKALSEVEALYSDLELLDWPRATEPAAREKADRAAKLVAKDFAHLREVAKNPSSKCQELIQTFANSDAIKMASNSSVQGKKSWWLAVVGTVYVVMSTVFSFFGQNFSLFGQGEQSMWLIGPTTFGSAVAAYLSYSFLEIRNYLQYKEALTTPSRAIMPKLDKPAVLRLASVAARTFLGVKVTIVGVRKTKLQDAEEALTGS